MVDVVCICDVYRDLPCLPEDEDYGNTKRS